MGTDARRRDERQAARCCNRCIVPVRSLGTRGAPLALRVLEIAAMAPVTQAARTHVAPNRAGLKEGAGRCLGTAMHGGAALGAACRPWVLGGPRPWKRLCLSTAVVQWRRSPGFSPL